MPISLENGAEFHRGAPDSSRTPTVLNGTVLMFSRPFSSAPNRQEVDAKPTKRESWTTPTVLPFKEFAVCLQATPEVSSISLAGTPEEADERCDLKIIQRFAGCLRKRRRTPFTVRRTQGCCASFR